MLFNVYHLLINNTKYYYFIVGGECFILCVVGAVH